MFILLFQVNARLQWRDISGRHES